MNDISGISFSPVTPNFPFFYIYITLLVTLLIIDMAACCWDYKIQVKIWYTHLEKVLATNENLEKNPILWNYNQFIITEYDTYSLYTLPPLPPRLIFQ